MPELCYPEPEEDTTSTPDTSGGITIVVDEDDSTGGGSKSGSCSALGSAPSQAGSEGWFSLLILLALLTCFLRRASRLQTANRT
jgi:hypothetical protein